MMHFNKKKVLVAALAVCLIAILSFSTLAWFTDSDDVTNQFHVATSDDQTPDDIFSVDVKERIDTDGDGEYDTTVDVGDVPDGGYDYEDIYPSAELVKWPIVKNTGAYDQYVRVKVTVDNAKAWMDMLAKYQITDLTVIFKGYDDSKWIRVDAPAYDAAADTITYTYYLDRVLTPEEEETLFTHVVIPYQLTQEDMAQFANGMFTMDIVAEAVQADNTGANAQEAFALVMGA